LAWCSKINLGWRCGKSPHPSSLREPTFSRKREKEVADDQRGAFLGALAAGFPSPALFAREKVTIASAIGG